MLRKNIEAARPRRIAVQFARGDTQHGGLTLQHLEAVGRHQDGTRRFVHPVIGASHALQQSRHAFRRAQLDHLIDAAPVNAEIE